MPLPGFVREAVRALLALMLLHQYVVLFFVVAIEEAGVPLPAPTDVVIAFYGFRDRRDLRADSGAADRTRLHPLRLHRIAAARDRVLRLPFHQRAQAPRPSRLIITSGDRPDGRA